MNLTARESARVAEAAAASAEHRQRSRHAHGDTARFHAVANFPQAVEGDDVGVFRASLEGASFEAIDCVCIVDVHERFRGAAPLARVLAASAAQKVEELVQPGWPLAAPDDDQELVAMRALHAGVSSLPVVGEDGRLFGVVPSATLMRILRHEHIEDLHRLAGIEREGTKLHADLHGAPTRRARHRLPWLVLGLAGSIGAAAVVSGFEAMLQKNVVLAFFVPMIVYLADAVGTQTEAIVVRGLSLNRTPLSKLILGELATGALIGIVLAVLAFPAVALLFGDVRIAVSVSIAIAAAGTVATTIGLVLPWALQRLGSDPALGSGPLATIIQDVLSILIYFAVAMLIVP